MKENKVQFIAITAMAVALTYVFTAFVNVRLPIAANGGLIHLGNVPLFIMAILFGKKTGAIAGGVGMGLFDLLSGWTAWAPFTFIIVGIMGYVVGAMTEKHDQYGWKVAAIFAAFVIKIVGYYIAEIILLCELCNSNFLNCNLNWFDHDQYNNCCYSNLYDISWNRTDWCNKVSIKNDIMIPGLPKHFLCSDPGILDYKNKKESE